MKYFLASCALFLMFTVTAFSQGKTVTHKVEKGETINEIAQKYKITPYDIYRLNPDAQSGLKPNVILIIPSKSEVKITLEKPNNTSKHLTHLVLAKETLYGIEKKYDVSDADLKKANPLIEKEGLQIGMLLTIPSKNDSIRNDKAVAINQQVALYHDVLPKETKYSISKKYGVTIEELEKRNPDIVSNLPIGYHLLIKGQATRENQATPQPIAQSKDEKEKLTAALTPINYVDYEVKPKETIYSLSKMFAISQEELVKLNPELLNGVEIGMIVKVPSTEIDIPVEKKDYTLMTKRITEGKRKRMVLLLPFNISRIENDTVNSTYNRLKKDKFLNMTLDFYAGALIAIDSAKTLGLPIDIEIYDSQETKNSSAVASLVQNNKLGMANAIVGPFYQSNAEITAQLVSANNVPVISPLSKDVGNPLANLYQTVPSSDAVKNTVFEFMRAHNGNIIAVVDKKKESIINYITENQKDVRFVAFKENGSLSAESLKSMLLKDRMNYVVMETANTWMIKTTIMAMISSMSNYQVQLVILEPNDTLDSDEINFVNLTKLKLMYPSVIRDNITPNAAIFDKKYRKINTIFPSDYATRGFDVTFDTMMRLVQDVKFEETVNAAATEQVENKFEYYKKPDGGYTNKGVFIMYYDTDLTIKEAK
jgi:LysM repeat protein